MTSSHAERPMMMPVQNPAVEPEPAKAYRPARVCCGHCTFVKPHGMVAAGKTMEWRGTCELTAKPEPAPPRWPAVNCDNDKCASWQEAPSQPTMTSPGRVTVEPDRPRYQVVIGEGERQRVVGTKATEEGAYALVDIWVLRGEKARVVDLAGMEPLF
jgi:hypothetical protein